MMIDFHRVRNVDLRLNDAIGIGGAYFLDDLLQRGLQRTVLVQVQ